MRYTLSCQKCSLAVKMSRATFWVLNVCAGEHLIPENSRHIKSSESLEDTKVSYRNRNPSGVLLSLWTELNPVRLIYASNAPSHAPKYLSSIHRRQAISRYASFPPLGQTASGRKQEKYSFLIGISGILKINVLKMLEGLQAALFGADREMADLSL